MPKLSNNQISRILGTKPSNFEWCLAEALGQRLRNGDRGLATRLWGSLANCEWSHPEHQWSACYTFRAAGDLIAALMDDGSNYMDWYCSMDAGVVDPEISQLLLPFGWVGKVY